MALEHFRILNNESLNKYLYMIPKQASLIILDTKLAVCMDKNGKDKNTPDTFP